MTSPDLPAAAAEPTILILDDERLQILTLQAQLNGMGLMRSFSDPVDALEFARGTRCDVAIVDVRMDLREFDGIEFLRRLRAFDPDISVIVRTSYAAPEALAAAGRFRTLHQVLKSVVTLPEIRRFVTEAIQDTRRRRRAASDDTPI